MGDFEVITIILPVFLLAVIIYTVINILSFKDILRRIGLMKISRRDFYECGVKPQNKRPTKISIQFLLICVFFLIYDIELIFLFPFVSGFTFSGLYDMFLLLLFFSVFLSSLFVDYTRHALIWQEIGRAHVELQSHHDLVCRLLLEKKKKKKYFNNHLQI